MLKQLWITVLAMLIAPATWATATYSITTVNYGTVSAPPTYYTTAMQVSGSFTMASRLAPNLTRVDVIGLVTAFSFADGAGNVITQANAINPHLTFSTDSNGEITDYDVDLTVTGPPIQTIRLYTSDFGRLSVRYAGNTASRNGNPGNFTVAVTADPVSTTSVPTLSEWALMTLAGLMLAGMAWQRRPRRPV
jgi:hypothetical protein